jgi:predicted aspartyl protease
MSQSVVSSHFPYLPLHLEIGPHWQIDTAALLDTGFDGDVALPPALIGSVHPPADYLRWTLADGSTVLAPVYLGTVQIGSLGPYPALITAVGDEPLVGRGVSDRFRIILDYGQRVVVES